jgi:hypothetical protein
MHEIRPGPEQIDPGCAPGGLVICAYDLNGECLTEDLLTPDVDPSVMGRATVQYVNSLPGSESVVLVVYDGDTGARWTPDDWRRFGLTPGAEL